MPSAQGSDNNDLKIEKDPHKISLSTELEHVTQEMYKKNVELSVTNKTLSILQKINAIILGSVTDLKQVSQQVVELIVSEGDFKRASIFIVRKEEGLVKLASSEGEAVKRAEYLVKKHFPSDKISLDNTNNLLVKVVNMPRLQITNNCYEVLNPEFTQEEAHIIQETLNIRTVLVYPLVIREEVIGVLSIGVGEDAAQISEYELDLMNRLAGIIGIAVDSSLLYQRIQDANERLKELDRLKDEFVSLASHELRTPMTAIKSYVWLLLYGNMGVISEKQKTYLERTYTSTERLINLVNDMLNISRIESGRFTIATADIDVNKLINEVLLEVQARAQEIGVKLEYTKSNDILTAKADEDRIKQVLINLIGNSIKFTPKDGVVTVMAIRDNQGFIKISVKDTGRGLSAEDIPKLFKKFNMVGNDHLTKERGQGTGLGLYLSKSLVELHGGKIWVESEGLGKGSTFSFTLPEVNVAMDLRKVESSDSVQQPVVQVPVTVRVEELKTQQGVEPASAGSVVGSGVGKTVPEVGSNTNSPSQPNPRV